MKISEVKRVIKEEVDQEVLQKLKNAIQVYSQTVSQRTSTDQTKAQSSASRPNRIDRLVSKIKSGEHRVSKELDRLIQNESERQIRSFVINSGNRLGEEILSNLDISSPVEKTAIRRTVSLRVTAALTGYANKKYLGGSADNFKTGKGFWTSVKKAASANKPTPTSNTQQQQKQPNQQTQNTQQQKQPNRQTQNTKQQRQDQIDW